MKRLFMLATLLTVSIGTLCAQQEITSSGSLVFNKVDLSGNLKVTLIPSDTARLIINLSGVDINRLNWTIKDSVLLIRLKPGMSGKGSGDVKLYYKQIENLKAAEANVFVDGVLKGLMVDVHLVSRATLTADVDIKDLLIRTEGSSVATLNGEVTYLTLLAGSKSSIDSRLVTAQDVRVQAGSGAEVYVSAKERLVMSADLGGTIFYKGKPEILRSTSKMMGSVFSIGN